MKVDFTKVKVEVTFGEYKEMNIARAIGNAIHQNTSDIGVDETARNIYHSEGEIEIPDEQINAVIYAISNASTILVSAKRAAMDLLKTVKQEQNGTDE